MIDKIRLLMKLHDIKGFAYFAPQRVTWKKKLDPAKPFILQFGFHTRDISPARIIYYSSAKTMLDGLQRIIDRKNG